MIVTVLPTLLQPPVVVTTTASPELEVAATVKVSPKSAVAGAGVVTVMVCDALPVVLVSVTSGAAS